MEVLAMLRQLIGQVKQLLELQASSSSSSSSSLVAVAPNISFHLQTPPLIHLPRWMLSFREGFYEIQPDLTFCIETAGGKAATGGEAMVSYTKLVCISNVSSWKQYRLTKELGSSVL